jgi:hypothetical protein
MNPGLPPQTDKVSLLALLPRRIRLDPVDLLEQCFEPLLKLLIFSTLVVLANKVAASGQSIVAERQCRVAEILDSLSVKTLHNR